MACVLGVHVDENGGWKRDGVLPRMTEKKAYAMPDAQSGGRMVGTFSSSRMVVCCLWTSAAM